jgi:hypothetical protein
LYERLQAQAAQLWYDGLCRTIKGADLAWGNQPLFCIPSGMLLAQPLPSIVAVRQGILTICPFCCLSPSLYIGQLNFYPGIEKDSPFSEPAFAIANTRQHMNLSDWYAYNSRKTPTSE